MPLWAGGGGVGGHILHGANPAGWPLRETMEGMVSSQEALP